MSTLFREEHDFPIAPKIVAAERLNDGVVVKFSDGHCGFFSDAYLFSKFSESQPLDETLVDW